MAEQKELLSSKKRKEIEDLIYKVFDTVDTTKTNSDYYRELFSKMSNNEFYHFLERRLPFRFHQEVFKIEPKMYQIVDAFKILNKPLLEKVNLAHIYRNKDGVPVQSKECLVIYIHLKRMKQLLNKKTNIALNIEKRDMKTGLLVGEDKAKELLNTKRIMENNQVSLETQEKVLKIIRSMGYSKSLQGIRPTSLEGKIVSDADMLDAIGACGIVRCMQFAIERCNQYNAPVFEKDVWPKPDMSVVEYRSYNRRNDNFINHFFEKLLKIKNIMLTPMGKKEAKKRHQIMVDFLYNFFEEQELEDWKNYLKDYENKNSKTS